MQTDKIKIKNDGAGMREAIDEAVKFAEYSGLDKKKSLRIRLLTEETLGMIGAITGDFDAEFWIESDKKCAVRICLEARTNMDFKKKQDLIEASSDKKNAAGKGIMGKIRQLIENGLYSIDEVGSLHTDYYGGTLMYASMGMCEVNPGSAINSMNYMWSLESYRNSFDSLSERDAVAEEAWDELEKSIVANIADDIRVGVSGNKVSLVIEKREF